MQSKDRMFVNYKVLKVLVTPLQHVVKYEAHISSDSDMYQKLDNAQRRLNNSIEEIENMVSIAVYTYPYICILTS